MQYLTTHEERPTPKACRALIVTPTRELAQQIADNLKDYGRGLGISHITVYGGVGYGPQIRGARNGVDIVVATPGRLLDLVQQRNLRLDQVEYLVLDEADRMLDMGFINEIRKILAMVPDKRQTAFFSATMAGAARRLADGILTDPFEVSVAPSGTPVELIDQQVVYVEQQAKRNALRDLLSGDEASRALIFCRTKHGANRLAENLVRQGVKAAAIHGNKTQSARQEALDEFREGKVRVLVATDIAARGIDVEDISHVINYDLPSEAEAYVHRIGRTARAGASGKAVSFCSYADRPMLREIERLIRQRIPVAGETAEEAAAAPDPTETKTVPQRGRSRGWKPGVDARASWMR